MASRALIAVALLLAGAQPAAATVAPGRVTVQLGAGGKHAGVDPQGFDVGTALPDGDLLLAGFERGGGVVVGRLGRDGTTERIAHLPIKAQPLQVLPRPSGGAVLVAAGEPAERLQLPQMIVIGLTGDGTIDRSFGDGGTARPGIQTSCANCRPSAVTPDGAIVVTGNTDGWVVARLTPAGALDAGFGRQGIATLPGTSGWASAVLPGGGIAATGRTAGGNALARLRSDGTADPDFHGGTPAPAPSGSFAFGALGRADGRVDVLVSDAGAAQLERYSPRGEPDPAFGDNGVVRLGLGHDIGELLPGPDGADIVTSALTLNPSLEPVGVHLARVAPDGRATETDRLLPFGGGYASRFARLRAPAVTPLVQNSFRAGHAIVRPDGSLIVPGAVAAIQYTGEGEGFLSDAAAIVALTPSFELDPAFGGTARPARIAVRVPRQRAATTADPRLLRVVVTATTSGPGLCLLEARAGRRVVARSTAPVYATGTQRLPALLTLTGRRVLPHARHVRVTVTARFRDLIGAEASARATGVLR